ncbi:MAG: hypothetical protein JWO42_489 [Chloroflexi bacterium]|nr:hypothetical protein [Chloroflexota bacterium]
MADFCWPRTVERNYVKRVMVHNRTRGVYLATDAGLATGLFTRFAGLMFRKILPEGNGLVLMPEGQIHMFFMRFPLDIVHADKEGKVLRILHGIKPWRLGPMVKKCRMVIELPAGSVAKSGTELGDVLELEELPK